MFANYPNKRKQKDEGEKPFWISFADLMTALMALFLVVMSVTLLAVTKKVSQEEQRKMQREQEIAEVMEKILDSSKRWSNVSVDLSTFRINMGTVVQFDRGQASISDEGQQFLRNYVPWLLSIYQSDIGKKWLKRILVEGFTDQDGSYLYNLQLSLERSRQVVCALYTASGEDEKPLSLEEKELIRQLFLVGGYSFNSMKTSKEESRRVELKLEFWQMDEDKPFLPILPDKEFGKC